MQTNVGSDYAEYTVRVPKSDRRLCSALIKKMGWELTVLKSGNRRKNGLDEALDDIRQGRVYKAESVDDLFKQLEA